MKPLSWKAWQESPVSRRQRRSPQWDSQKQQYNYYKLYCYRWMEYNPGCDRLAVFIQAHYQPVMAEAIEQHLLYGSSFLKIFKSSAPWTGATMVHCMEIFK